MKKKFALIISILLSLILTGCEAFVELPAPTTTREKVSLKVTTTWAGKNMSSQQYQAFVKAFTTTTGIEIIDNSETADERFKQRVQTDFRVGSEPDVMFYFTGEDAESMIKAGKLVSVEEIREDYPEYADNISEDAMIPSEVDGRCYSVPAYGYWEALYVNTKVCKEAGIAIPDERTTWSEFMAMCEKVKEAGYIPIAASIASEPHYLFEYFVYNNSTEGTQAEIPEVKGDEAYIAWEKGVEQIKALYERGFFSKDSLYSDDDVSFRRFLNNEAAFCINGSWMIATILKENASKYSDYTVTYVPGSAARKSTDIIGGFSSGWYISRKAWADPDKRDAAVEFVKYMTQNSVIDNMANITMGATSLKSGAVYRDTSGSLVQKAAVEMFNGKTDMVPAVQDKLSADERAPFMDSIKDVVSGKIESSELLDEFLRSRRD